MEKLTDSGMDFTPTQLKGDHNTRLPEDVNEEFLRECIRDDRPPPQMLRHIVKWFLASMKQQRAIEAIAQPKTQSEYPYQTFGPKLIKSAAQPLVPSQGESST
jgi:hypothetical protein